MFSAANVMDSRTTVHLSELTREDSPDDLNVARRARYALRMAEDEGFVQVNRARSKRYYERHKQLVIARVAAYQAKKRAAEDAHWRDVQAAGGDVPKNVLRRWKMAENRELKKRAASEGLC